MKVRMVNKLSDVVNDFTNVLQVWTDIGWVDVPVVDGAFWEYPSDQLGDEFLEV